MVANKVTVKVKINKNIEKCTEINHKLHTRHIDQHDIRIANEALIYCITSIIVIKTLTSTYTHSHTSHTNKRAINTTQGNAEQTHLSM